jgi:hypothetical protein
MADGFDIVAVRVPDEGGEVTLAVVDGREGEVRFPIRTRAGAFGDPEIGVALSGHVLQSEPQCMQGVVQPALHHGIGDSQVAGNLRRRPSQVIRSPNHGAMRGAQLAHGVADLLSIQSRFETFVVSP